ncbi:divalent-cation tolerance protein CutA [Vulcanococcus limneticus]|uniref:divalent-cation tolerance protein CutA n=1 Tax=Vulcanococcus limneticus TaxID=2170428 RepID=UPI000B9938D6|nr:divalent-cation tolerance protein CutA [Vulcanococcus limneticus]MCP9790646.1 divalent-cation tolerance protein CutA [Vulcanococcus limneticus MW73D5]MCP9892725.1 divalent-cation tolerance protein CutA [Vulcanococcus limneticus Candia 3F8]MCP9896253.1 divalent-cation tolerance protein CutA [Vulcanococcus limneticus Candia 3B3]
MAADPALCVLVALTTEADLERAEALATALVQQGLAACVALEPQRSIYRWQGRLERSEEVRLTIKGHPARLAALEAEVRRLHSYATPQWIHWIASASGAYGDWVAQACGEGVLD